MSQRQAQEAATVPGMGNKDGIIEPQKLEAGALCCWQSDSCGRGSAGTTPRGPQQDPPSRVQTSKEGVLADGALTSEWQDHTGSASVGTLRTGASSSRN